VAWAKSELGVWIVALVETDAIASGNESDGLFCALIDQRSMGAIETSAVVE
jgi:hypothetical protein